MFLIVIHSCKDFTNFKIVKILRIVVGFRTFFGNESKLKFANGRFYDDLKLSNKGKMKKTKAEFHHKKAGDSSGKFLRMLHFGLMQGASRF